jgi:hypothetical protein
MQRREKKTNKLYHASPRKDEKTERKLCIIERKKEAERDAILRILNTM